MAWGKEISISTLGRHQLAHAAIDPTMEIVAGFEAIHDAFVRHTGQYPGILRSIPSDNGPAFVVFMNMMAALRRLTPPGETPTLGHFSRLLADNIVEGGLSTTRSTGEFQPYFFFRLQLQGLYLRGADLYLARMDDVDASYADLGDADLRGGSLRNGVFRGALFDGAYLSVQASGANFRGASFRGARLVGADLTYADLSGADLTGADMSNAELENARVDQDTVIDTSQLGDHVRLSSGVIVTKAMVEREKRNLERWANTPILVDGHPKYWGCSSSIVGHVDPTIAGAAAMTLPAPFLGTMFSI